MGYWLPFRRARLPTRRTARLLCSACIAHQPPDSQTNFSALWLSLRKGQLARHPSSLELSGAHLWVRKKLHSTSKPSLCPRPLITCGGACILGPLLTLQVGRLTVLGYKFTWEDNFLNHQDRMKTPGAVFPQQQVILCRPLELKPSDPRAPSSHYCFSGPPGGDSLASK